MFRKDIDAKKLREFIMQGHLAFQDYAISKWFFHLNAFVEKGVKIISTERGLEIQPSGKDLKVVSPEGDVRLISPEDVVQMMPPGFRGVTSNLDKVLDDFFYCYEGEEWDESKNGKYYVCSIAERLTANSISQR